MFIQGVYFEIQPVCPECTADIVDVNKVGWVIKLHCSCGWGRTVENTAQMTRALQRAGCVLSVTGRHRKAKVAPGIGMYDMD